MKKPIVLLAALAFLLSRASSAGAHGSSGASCTVGVDYTTQHLVVSAQGLDPNTYFIEAQKGVQSVLLKSDSSGAVAPNEYLVYYGPGTYRINFAYPADPYSGVVATCKISAG